jgi:hypothetical protein
VKVAGREFVEVGDVLFITPPDERFETVVVDLVRLFCHFVLALCKEHTLRFGGTEVLQFCHSWFLHRTVPHHRGDGFKP